MTCCAFSPDGERLVSGSGGLDPVCKLWDADTGQELATFDHSGDGAAGAGTARGGVDACAFSPDGRQIVSVGSGKLCVWDALRRRLLGTLPAPLAMPYTMT